MSSPEDESRDGPHAGQRVATAGSDLGDATAAMILIHGRGATARGILELTRELDRDDVAYFAPQAANNTWYPYSFLEPVERNEPGRTSGLKRVETLIEEIRSHGIERDRIGLLGFSQGACLASEYVVRHPRRYGGLIAFSGGLIGESIEVDSYDGDLDRTPVFIGCSDVDPHIPKQRVEVTAKVFDRLNADLTWRLYDGMGHTINDDERSAMRSIVDVL